MAAKIKSLPDVDGDTLATILRRPDAQLDGDWECRPLSGGAGHSLGVYRLEGHASFEKRIEPWSLILKICPGDDGESGPGQWLYGPREALAYRSGLIATLPAGLRAPACFEVSDRPDGTAWVWMEEVQDEQPGPWSLHRHVLAARELGKFSAGCLAAPPPDVPWMRRGVLRRLAEAAAPTMASLDTLSIPDAPPVVRAFFTPAIMAGIRRLWDDRHLLLDAYDSLPAVLCHRDAHRNNLRARRLPDGSEELIALDWEYVGWGVPGEELAGQLVGSAILSDIGDVAVLDFDTACFAGYLHGMRDAGWEGDPRTVRLGHTTSLALRWGIGLIPGLALMLGDPAVHTAMEALIGRPIEDIGAQWRDSIWPWCLSLADEARTLIAASPPAA
jgi:hypothetical protein